MPTPASRPLKVIKLAKIPDAGGGSSGKLNSLRLLSQLCYYYPAYTLAEARKLPYKHVVLMLRVARQLEAQRYYNEVQIAAAPHTKKMSFVKKLSEQFMGVMRNG